MKCAKCGATLAPKSEFCSECGAKVEGKKFGFSIHTEQLKEMSANASKVGGEMLKNASATLSEKAGEAKDAAFEMKDDITAKITELDRMLEGSITEYAKMFHVEKK